MARYRQPDEIAIVREGDQEIDISKITNGAIYEELVNLCDFALHSSNIYEAMEKRFEITTNGWEPISIDFNPSRPWFAFCKVKGLQLEVWKKSRSGRNDLIAIVFRGTDAEQIGDWISNFRWLTRLIPILWDQYDQTRAIIPKIIDFIHENHGTETEIVTTGHSLGGGLAQQAGYCSEHIHAVYAFDPSVVTGYHSVRKQEREKNTKGMVIFRVYEHGEILAYLRLAMKAVYRLNPKPNNNPKFIEIRVNFSSTPSRIGQHSMKMLAQELQSHKKGLYTNTKKKINL